MARSAVSSSKRFYRLALQRHWLAYTAGTLVLLLTSVTEVLMPKFIQWSIDVVSGQDGSGASVPTLLQGSDPTDTLRNLAGALVLTLFAGLFGRIGWRQLLARRTHVAGRDLKVGLWDVLRYVPLSTLHRHPLGDLMNRATGDWSAARAIHGFTIVMTFDLVFLTVLSVISMLRIDWELTLYCLAVFPLLPRLVARLARKEHDLHIWAQEKLGHLSDHISQALGTIRLQRSTATDAIWQATLARESRIYADRRFQVVKTGWKIFPLGAIPTLIAYGVLLVLGVGKLTSGELTVGGFVAMQSYVLMLQAPLFELGDCISEWQKGFASLGRILEIFRLEPLAAKQLAKRERPADGTTLRIEELTYAYEDAPKRSVLQGINLTVNAGESIGIFGSIGSGKSTLLKLVSGLLEPPPGQVYIGGTSVDRIERAWLSRQVTMVPQRAFLFAGTIRYNLELSESYEDEKLWEVLRTVRLDEDVRAFPQGLSTWIGEWGVNLSGGQKQRLSLARALLRDGELLLLDDCLSAVDSVTEELILEALRSGLSQEPGRERRTRTILWVAHRSSTLKLCDRIFSLEEGRLAPVTSHGVTKVLLDIPPKFADGVEQL